VTVVSLSGMARLITFALLAAAAHCLRIVLLLWSAGIARSIRRGNWRKT
jgi:hypothetical protein